MTAQDAPGPRCGCSPAGNLAPLPECAVADALAAAETALGLPLPRGVRGAVEYALKAAAPHIRTYERRRATCRDITSGCTCQPDGQPEDICDYRLLGDTVAGTLNPIGDDTAEVAILGAAVERIAAYVRSLPCTCGEGVAAYDEDPCGRCSVIGQRCGKAEPR